MSLLNRIKSHLVKSTLNKNGKGIYIDFLLYVDEKSTFEGYNRITGRSSIYNSHIGSYTYAVGASIGNATVGKFCSIAMGAKVGGLGSHPTSYVSTHPIFYSAKRQCGISFSEEDYFKEDNKTVIGNDVWIGANAIIMDGVHVSDGAIIATGAIVTKDVPPYAIVTGIPAVIKKFRCSIEQVQILQHLAWWNWPQHLLKKHTKSFQGPIDDNLEDLAKVKLDPKEKN